VYSFDGRALPEAGLISVGGTLYGTTYYGGPENCGYPMNPLSCGTVFKVTKAGVETVVYSFQGASDAAFPAASLIKVGGTLYGTTFGGGTGFNCSYAGCGTVFAITP
jgi:hypothetical protein